jgi:ATP-dependent DNA helicase RecQ
VRYAEDERTCRRKPLLNYFGESYEAENCSNCDNCNSSPTPLTDITLYAQKFLSCVKRADEKFGAGHIADILRGSKNEKILRWEHDKLSTYGIGKELTKKQWMHIARQLLSMDYLKKEGEYHTLSLTVKALEMLKKRETVFGVMQEAERVRTKSNKVEIEYNNALFALLRQKRKELADAAEVPPYVIFSDRTLIEMAAYYPQSSKSLLNIAGIGQAKLEKYGDTFLEVIKAYCEKRELKEISRKSVPTSTSGGSETLGGRTRILGEAFNDGASVQELMERYSVKANTVLDHLNKYLLARNKLRDNGDLQSLSSATPDQQQAAFAAFEELSPTYLKPVFDKLNGELNYDELKILRMLYLVSHQDDNTQ